MGFLEKIFPSKRIGLALGAGGARGLAHIGVIRALQERDFEIVGVSGSSMGAIIGAMFAFEPSWEAVYGRLREYFDRNREKLSTFDIFRGGGDPAEEAVPRAFRAIRASIYRLRMYRRFIGDNHILGDDILWEFICAVLPDERIENAKVPLAVVTYDILTQREVVFTAGPVRQIVIASSSIPGIFPPQDVDGMLLVDGGAISPVPVNPLVEMGLRKIFAVDVSPPSSRNKDFSNAVEVIFSVLNGALDKIKRTELERASMIISPGISGIEWWRFEYFDSIIRKGYNKTIRMLMSSAPK